MTKEEEMLENYNNKLEQIRTLSNENEKINQIIDRLQESNKMISRLFVISNAHTEQITHIAQLIIDISNAGINRDESLMIFVKDIKERFENIEAKLDIKWV